MTWGRTVIYASFAKHGYGCMAIPNAGDGPDAGDGRHFRARCLMQ
jgi:hypothetical protein